jgi:translocation and assembly module TamB
MDYIEVKSGSFDNASFVVGKYLTDKIFVSYEQNLGKIENPDVARYEMRMEYELFKFLFLQLTSSSLNNGFDIIFKFDEKQKVD